MSGCVIIRLKQNSLLLKHFKLSRDISLETVSRLLRHYIISRNLFDELNCRIIVCDDYLEEIFGAKTVYCDQVVSLILKQSTALISADELHYLESVYSKQFYWQHPSNDKFTVNVETIWAFNKVYPSNELLEVLRSLPGAKLKQKSFIFRTLCAKVDVYLEKNADRLMDIRSPDIYNISSDLLKQAFKVNYFHKCQLNRLVTLSCRRDE